MQYHILVGDYSYIIENIKVFVDLGWLLIGPVVPVYCPLAEGIKFTATMSKSAQ